MPTLLAGPILRRVTATQVVVWVAANQHIDYELLLFDKQQQTLITEDSNIIVHQQQVGSKKSNLWVSLLQVELQEGKSFPLNTLIYYDIKGIDLTDICLEGEKYPSFYIPENLSVIAHGSCRKPHGKAKYDESSNGTPPADALATLATYLHKHKNSLQHRPSHLFLTGDQIYADDVAPSLLSILKEKAVELMGEELPIPGIENPSQLSPEQRGEKLKSLNCGLTTTKTDYHLMTFGEYAAMYLFVFGNASNWQLQTTNKYLISFVETLPNVRKTLANIPIYMIFDDHDVTDDWNLTRNWYDTVRFNATGRRVISNALATYYIFQHIGNSDDALNNDLNEAIQLHLADKHNMKRCEYYDLYLWKHRRWSYSLPTNPPIIVLDTRTQRDFTGRFRAAPLLDRYAIDWLRTTWVKLQAQEKTRTPLIISSTPVIGFEPIEKVQRILVQILLFISPIFVLFSKNLLSRFTRVASKIDFESWIANKKGFTLFMETLLTRMKVKKVVFLSGDVHYSFVYKGHYTTSDDKLECLQLTSSAIHNSPSGSNILNTVAIMSNRTVVRRGLRPLQHLVSRSLMWKLKASGIQLSGEQQRYLTRRPNVGLVFFDDAGEVYQQSLLSDHPETPIVSFNIK